MVWFPVGLAFLNHVEEDQLTTVADRRSWFAVLPDRMHAERVTSSSSTNWCAHNTKPRPGTGPLVIRLLVVSAGHGLEGPVREGGNPHHGAPQRPSQRNAS